MSKIKPMCTCMNSIRLDKRGYKYERHETFAVVEVDKYDKCVNCGHFVYYIDPSIVNIKGKANFKSTRTPRDHDDFKPFDADFIDYYPSEPLLHACIKSQDDLEDRADWQHELHE